MLLIFAAIAVLFVVLLVGKGVIKSHFCVICASVSMTWAALLGFFWAGMFDEPILIAVLMGESVVGLYYLVEKKTKEQLHIFRLPFLLTATFVAYVLLGRSEGVVASFLLLLSLWVVFGIIYLSRTHAYTHKVVERIIACCRDW
jgi:hypothetical protein